jgi:hypothetical protein
VKITVNKKKFPEMRGAEIQHDGFSPIFQFREGFVWFDFNHAVVPTYNAARILRTGLERQESQSQALQIPQN